MSGDAGFQESHLTTPIRDLGLAIAGTRLEPVIHEFQQELDRVGIVRLKPEFYLSTEWGVAFPSTSIGIPFYLARPDLTEVHAERVGHLEGIGRVELLRYLRHEMGHVVNYAYQLYEQEEWVKHFGSMTQPYLEEYQPEPFSQDYVWHLPGWYAQKHPDEDWAETFAVWMTPGFDWRSEYSARPGALAKLEYCDRTMAVLNQTDPPMTTAERDEDVSTVAASIEAFYKPWVEEKSEGMPPGLDGALRAIFEDFGVPEDAPAHEERRSAAKLIRTLERELMANVYRWTGHFPEQTRRLLRHLERLADQLHQVYPAARERDMVIAVTTLVTSLAMNHVMRGSYLP